MVIHTFGAIYGISASFFFQPKEAIENKYGRDGSTYSSDIIAIIGTLFLWMYWPSFNGALGSPIAQERVAVNTYLALACCCITACWIARVSKGKLDIEILLNATLAGGVALGASADLVSHPFGAMIIGSLAGIVSALGYAYFTPVAR